MAVFEMLTYSCVIVNGFAGELMSKTCRWDGGVYYVQQSKCAEKGAALIGNPVFSDMAENRKIENFRCSPISVIE